MRAAILKQFRSILPPISQTEREALESGTVGWDGELMKGKPDWDKLFALPPLQLTAEEQHFLDTTVAELCDIIDNWQTTQDNDLAPAVWDFIKSRGLMGLEIPKEYGGHGFSSQLHSAAVIKIASRSIAAAVTVMVPNSLGPAELIHAYGTEEQKNYYLPRLAKGEETPCFALTSPVAGSDAGALTDRGVLFRDDSGTLSIRLNWEKRYITLGPVATLIGLAFKLEDPENLLGTGKKDLGITVALIPRDTAGVTIGDRHAPMDLPFQNGPNYGRDVVVPATNIIGGTDMAGHGWRMLMECLAVGRSLSLPALSTAGAKVSAYATGAYGRVRKQFNLPIAKFEGIEEPLARMGGLTYMMNAARVATLQMVDGGERPAIPSAILKYHLTENMRLLVNDAMDVHGGKAIVDGPNNIFADLYKGIPVAITVEGANIMTRNLMIFGQGAVRAHPYVLREMEAMNDPDDAKAFSKLMKTVALHAGSAMWNALRTLFHGLTWGIASTTPDAHAQTKKYYRQVNRLSAALNLATDTALLTLGGGLKRKERMSARLGDVFSYLYLASTTLWYFEKDGRRADDLPLVHWACKHALAKAEEALLLSCRNHPRAVAGWIVRLFVFPLGRLISAPSDKLDAVVAELLRTPSDVRDRLTDGIFKPQSGDHPLAVLEQAFHAAVDAEAIEKRIQQEIKSGRIDKSLPLADRYDLAAKTGLITGEERLTLDRAETLRAAVVRVDAFTQDSKYGTLAKAA